MSSGNLLVPFLLGAGAVRGRLVRLGPALDEILGSGAYPVAVAEQLAEALALAAALAGALKFEGVFTLQVQGDGPIGLLVCDVTSEGDMRAYARCAEDRLSAAEGQPGPPVPRLFGAGHLAFTIDRGPDMDRTQGIVALEGATLADCAAAYLARSEQIATELLLVSRAPGGDEGWRAAAVMVQRMPPGPRSPILTAESAAEAWNRAAILLRTASAEEMLDERLAPERLLHRLYHADGLVVQAKRPLRARCRCSAVRVEATLASFPREEIAALRDESGAVVVTCEFCRARYVFDERGLERLYAAGG